MSEVTIRKEMAEKKLGNVNKDYELTIQKLQVSQTGHKYEGESVIICTVCFMFRKTRAEILKLHDFFFYFPCFTMHFVHHCTICFMTSE
jgi:hypothetical protein